MGSSAGATSSMWIGFFDDMADINSNDPIERESTKVSLIVGIAAAHTMDLNRWKEMANIKSQKKRILTNEKSRQRNMAVRSRMRTMIKHALTAIEAKDAEQVKTAVPAALSAIDRAASKGVIHANNAARKKSSIQHRAAAL